MRVSLQDADGFGKYLGSLLEHVRVKSVSPAGALFSIAYARQPGENPYFLTGRCLFQHEPRPSRRHEYLELLLDEWWLDGEEAIATLVEAVKGKGALNGVPMPECWIPSVERHVGERPSFTGWPEWVFDLRVKRDRTQGPPSEPVVRHGLRPYSSGIQAILDWVWRAPTKQSSQQPHEDKLIVVVPDFRSRIKAAEWRGQTLTVHIEGEEEGLQLQSLVLAGSTHQPLAVVDDTAMREPAILDVPQGAERIELFLVRPTGELASEVTLARAGEEFEATPGEPTPEEHAATDLRNGEGQQVEFKPFISPSDPKEEEVIRTIVALANTDGGRLYVGVRDTGVPEGEPALCRAARADAAG